MDFEKLHREESGRILSTLIGLLGDFDLAEEMLQEAYATALQKWPSEGVPANPRAWLISTARHKAIDRLRRVARLSTKGGGNGPTAQSALTPHSRSGEKNIICYLLRLIITLVPPALRLFSRAALSLLPPS